MAYKSTWSALKVLDCWFGGQAITPPATLYFALTTTVPTKAAAGTEVGWAGASPYARVAIANNLTSFPSAQPKVNAVAITWPAVSAGLGPFVIVGIDIYDAASGGNRIGFGVPTSRTLQAGDVYSVAVGLLSATEI